MRYLFLFGLIVVSVLAAEAANSQSHQQKPNPVTVHHNRAKSAKPANSLASVHHRSKPVTKQRAVAKSVKSNRNVAKKQSSNKKAKGVLVDRNGKRRRAVVKSKPRRKTVRAVRKITRRVNRVKPSNRGRSIRRRASQRKRLAKQEEADIENSDQEGFGDEQQQNADGSGTSSSDAGSTSEQPAEQPAVVAAPEEPASSDAGTSSAAQPAVDTTNQSAAPQLPANLPSNFNQITKINQAGKNAVGIGYASNSNGPAVAFGYATSINGQNSAGGFGASFSAPDLLNAA